jgi:hypothetical protein
MPGTVTLMTTPPPQPGILTYAGNVMACPAAYRETTRITEGAIYRTGRATWP